MTTTGAVMSALATALAGSDKLAHGYDHEPHRPVPPYAVVAPPADVQYDETIGESPTVMMTFEVEVRVSDVVTEAAQANVAALTNATGSSSLRAQIDADDTLGGIVDYARVARWRTIGRLDADEVGFYGGVLTIEVCADT